MGREVANCQCEVRILIDSTNSNRRRWWLPAIGLAIGLAGGAHLLSVAIRGDAQPGAARTTATTPVRSVVAFGMVDAQDGIIKMWATVPGAVVSEVLVKQGDTVQAGAVLLRLDNTLARKKLDEASAAVEVAKAARDRGRTLPEQHRLGLEQCEAAVKAAEARRNMAQQDLEKTQHLAGIDQANQGALRIAQEQLRAAEQEILSQKAALARLKLQDPKTEMQGLEAQVKQAVAMRDGAEAALSQYELVAKKAGNVLTITVGVGDTIVGPTPMPTIQLCPAGPRVVRADVDQSNASLVAVGQRVSIEDDTHAAGKWTGHVQTVADMYAPQRTVLQGDPNQYSDVRTMPCVIDLDPDQPPLKINQRVLVTIEVPIK
jgi:multidrug resistance efflux pump